MPQDNEEGYMGEEAREDDASFVEDPSIKRRYGIREPASKRSHCEALFLTDCQINCYRLHENVQPSGQRPERSRTSTH